MLDLRQGPPHSLSNRPPLPVAATTREEECLERYVVDVATLDSVLHRPDTLIVDLRSNVEEGEGYLPGAIHLDYDNLIRRLGAIEGLIPQPAALSRVLSSIGLKPWHSVFAYDDETGAEASRFLWSLASVGHTRFALLDGGYEAWIASGNKTVSAARVNAKSTYSVDSYTTAVVDKKEVLRLLGDENTVIVDTRGAGEYSGEERRAERGGHIPGAVHFNWMEAIDLFGDGGLRDADKLRIKLKAKGITQDKRIIVYCQSNRRSAHTFIVLKWLGFENVSAYDGSWSDWGNDPEMPVEDSLSTKN
ncbi:MAG: sulfurtransferase [Acidiferrobacterales bacterium]|nr:sulfurtransferase [Acidiferrobacterales bacterium]